MVGLKLSIGAVHFLRKYMQLERVLDKVLLVLKCRYV